MKIFLTLILFTILIACSQNQQTKAHFPDPKAKHLVDSALRLADRPGNYEKALTLIDKATQIDSNYYDAYFYKLSLQLKLSRLNDALATSKDMIRLDPRDYERYSATASLYWQIGDTVSATDYYTKAAVLFDKIFDTMSRSNRSYEPMLMQKGFYLIMTGKQEQGNKIWSECCNSGRYPDLKKEYEPLLNKSRKEIMEEIFSPNTTSSGDTTIIIK